MKFIVIDTCIVLHILKLNEIGQKCLCILEQYGENVSIIISVVTKAELESIKIQRNWGDLKSKKLTEFLTHVTCIDISHSDKALIDAYARIEAYSKGKIADKNGKMLEDSAKKLGKNDLWIAATAYTLGVPLLTADNDFYPLNNSFLDLIKVS